MTAKHLQIIKLPIPGSGAQYIVEEFAAAGVAAEIFPSGIDADVLGFAQAGTGKKFAQLFFEILQDHVVFRRDLTCQSGGDEVAEIEKLKFTPKVVFFVKMQSVFV